MPAAVRSIFRLPLHTHQHPPLGPPLATRSIHLRNAEAVTAKGEELSWPELLVRGRLLRYISIPPEVDVREAIAAKQAAMHAGRMAYARKPKKAKT